MMYWSSKSQDEKTNEHLRIREKIMTENPDMPLLLLSKTI